MQSFISLLARFRNDERGVFAVFFGLMAVVLIAFSGAVVDYVYMDQSRNRAQVALDAAALALQEDSQLASATTTNIQARALALVQDRVGDARVAVAIDETVINRQEGKLFFSGSIEVPTFFVNLVGVPSLAAPIQSEVARGSLDVEVAVVVDITGSMTDRVPISGSSWRTEQKIESLRRSLNELIDLVVKDEQEPSTSRMAIVPYSMGVNVGVTWAPTIRGAVRGPTGITNIAWASASAKTISAATRANPVEVTASNHGLIAGDYIYISSLSAGMTQIGNRIFRVGSVSGNNVRLQTPEGVNVNGNNYGTYSRNSATLTKCLVPTCELQVTSANHGLTAGTNAHVYGVRGMNSYPSVNDRSSAYYYDRANQFPSADYTSYNWINNNTETYTWANDDYSPNEYKFLVWRIRGPVTTNTFVLEGTARTNGKSYGTYTSGGNVSCVTAGCQFYLYQNRYNANDSWRLQQISTCVTERATNGLTNASPATTLLGRNYPTPANPCPSVVIQPLTDDKTILHDLADSLPATGSTAGHLGAAWGWYMVSPNFRGPWPALNQPAPATGRNVLRAVVLMTDGAFNTSYCNGVISQLSSSGSGYDQNKINCDSPNGNSFEQAQKLCNAMKAATPPIRIYTVAFDVGNIQAARDIMANCASEPAFAFEATTGADLDSAFEEIGRNLAYLRVTQ